MMPAPSPPRPGETVCRRPVGFDRMTAAWMSSHVGFLSSSGGRHDCRTTTAQLTSRTPDVAGGALPHRGPRQSVGGFDPSAAESRGPCCLRHRAGLMSGLRPRPATSRRRAIGSPPPTIRRGGRGGSSSGAGGGSAPPRRESCGRGRRLMRASRTRRTALSPRRSSPGHGVVLHRLVEPLRLTGVEHVEAAGIGRACRSCPGC